MMSELNSKTKPWNFPEGKMASDNESTPKDIRYILIYVCIALLLAYILFAQF